MTDAALTRDEAAQVGTFLSALQFLLRQVSDPLPEGYAQDFTRWINRMRELAGVERRLAWPLPSGIGVLTGRFGEVDDLHPDGHKGIDLAAPLGMPVLAVADGVVVQVWQNDGVLGNALTLDIGGDDVVLYAHLSVVKVPPGAQVQQDQEIGEVGSTGLSTGPHLHFGVWHGGKPVDPLAVLGMPPTDRTQTNAVSV